MWRDDDYKNDYDDDGDDDDEKCSSHEQTLREKKIAHTNKKRNSKIKRQPEVNHCPLATYSRTHTRKYKKRTQTYVILKEKALPRLLAFSASHRKRIAYPKWKRFQSFTNLWLAFLSVLGI